MPWSVSKSGSCPDSKPWAVIKDSDGSVVACHETEQSAKDQVAALYASEEDGDMGEERQMIRALWRKIQALFSGVMPAEDIAEEQSQADQFRAIGMMRVQEQIWALLQQESAEGWAYPIDVYIGDDWIYTLVARGGKLYRVNLFLEGDELRLGEWQQVTELHPPIEQRMTIQRQADGRWRWLNISASAVLNRVGEIDSRQLFDNMARRAEESGEYPYRTFFHMGEALRIGQADYLARDGALYITSGVFDDNPLAAAVVRAIQGEPDYWGDSIGYLPVGVPERVEVAEGVEVPVYSDGIHREISTLPENRAASLFTVPNVQQEVSRMRPDVLEALERLRDQHGLDQSVIDGFVELADQTNRSIEDEDLITRDSADESAADEEQAPEQPEGEDAETADVDEDLDEELQEREEQTETDLDVELDEEAVQAIVDRLAEAPIFTELTQRLDLVQASLQEARDQLEASEGERAEVERRLADLERDDEEKRREWLDDQPRRRTIRASYRPREVNQQENSGKERESNLADEAEHTLARMPRY